jgi:hypothetical protein
MQGASRTSVVYREDTGGASVLHRSGKSGAFFGASMRNFALACADGALMRHCACPFGEERATDAPSCIKIQPSCSGVHEWRILASEFFRVVHQ